MSIWKELELLFRDPTKHTYSKENAEKAAEAFKKAFSDNEEKAKQLLTDLKTLAAQKPPSK